MNSPPHKTAQHIGVIRTADTDTMARRRHNLDPQSRNPSLMDGRIDNCRIDDGRTKNGRFRDHVNGQNRWDWLRLRRWIETRITQPF